MLGGVGANTLRANVIVHDGDPDIFCQVANPIHILSTIQESRNLPSFYQRDKVSDGVV